MILSFIISCIKCFRINIKYEHKYEIKYFTSEYNYAHCSRKITHRNSANNLPKRRERNLELFGL